MSMFVVSVGIRLRTNCEQAVVEIKVFLLKVAQEEKIVLEIKA